MKARSGRVLSVVMVFGEGQKCGSASCSADGNTFTPEPKCDGNGTCTPGTPQNCAPYQCALTGCARNCSKQADCDTGTYCNTTASTCAAQKTNGTAASQTYECQSGIIANGVCCNTACGECNSCSTGTCTPTSSGSVCGGGGKVCVSGGCQAGCWITGQYFSSGATNASNACQSCQPTTSTSGWSTKGEGASCGTGKTCSSGDCQCTTGTDCGASGCINVNGDDSNHCGSCTNVCTAGKSCTSGVCACTKGAPACGGCLAWDFESGTQYWVRDTDPYYPIYGGLSLNGAQNPTTSTDITYTGSTRSLQVGVNIDMDTVTYASVAVPICQSGGTVDMNGRTIRGQVFFSGTGDFHPLAGMQAFAWGPSGNYRCMFMWGTNMKNGTWVPGSCQLTFNDGVESQSTHVALGIFNSGPAWSGTMYIDDVHIE